MDQTTEARLAGIREIAAGNPADGWSTATIRFLLVEVDRLTESANRADALREAAVSALCHLTEGPEVVGTQRAMGGACQVLSEALQATKHPQGAYRLTSIQRTLLERRGWQGQEPVPWLLKQNDRNDLGGEG